jgi:hypothetical protein
MQWVFLMDLSSNGSQLFNLRKLIFHCFCVQYLSESSDCTSSNCSHLDILPCNIQVSVNSGLMVQKLCFWRSKGSIIAKFRQQLVTFIVWSCRICSSLVECTLDVIICIRPLIIVNNPIGCLWAMHSTLLYGWQ